jgi:heterodisulfide reductase subunit A
VKHVVVIGGGVAGIETAAQLSKSGHWVTVVERSNQLGGKLNDWHCLFPDFSPAKEQLDWLQSQKHQADLQVLLETKVTSVNRTNGRFAIETSGKDKLEVDAVVVASGYELFDARRKEEYGYKIYERVITSADLEKRMNNGELLRTPEGAPNRVAFVHCVGSRDEKSGNHYCSKVCCITGVKQAIELKKLSPGTEIFCFYMDLRMYGKHFEELYRTAQEKYDIQFIRGRLSEAAEKIDKSLQIKAEDTLSGRPLKMNVDWLVLLVGMEAGTGTAQAASVCGSRCESSGFIATADEHRSTNLSSQEGIFVAGSCTGPMSVTDTILHARSAACEVNNYFQKLEKSWL